MLASSPQLTSLFWIASWAPSVLAHIPTYHELRLLKRTLDKPVIEPNFYDTLLDPGLRSILPNTSYTISDWTADLIPSDCKELIEGQSFNDVSLSAADVEVFNVTYADCDQPWVMCRHNKAPGTADDMAETFSQLPVRMRSYLRHMMAIPGERSAFSTGQNTVVVGTAIGSLTVYGHEVGHSLDGHAFQGVSGDFSDTDTWVNAYNQDSAVCEAYAQTNQQENFAQMVNVVLYDQNAQGGIANICSNCQEIGHQTQAIEDNIGDTLKVGGTCANRLVTSEAVPKGGTSDGGTTLSNGDIVLTSIPATGDTGTATATPTTTATGSVIVETFGSPYPTTPQTTHVPSDASASGGILYEYLLSFAAFLMFL